MSSFEAVIERMRLESELQFSNAFNPSIKESFQLFFPDVNFNELMPENGVKIRDGNHHFLDTKTGFIYFYNPLKSGFSIMDNCWRRMHDPELQSQLFIL
jgi:hypothetical protein